jgi:hypothetical protein
MKVRHWINLIVVGLTAGLLTFLASRWGITSYVEPTCRGYAESQGMTYVGFIPPDSSQDTGPSHMSRDGNCQLRTSNGEVQTVSLVAASGTDYGAPFFGHFALAWEFVFLASFMGVAFILAIVTRAFTPKKAAS